METRASYTIVGAFVLALIAAGVGFALWLSQVSFEREPVRYQALFAGDVTGLDVGSVVRYRGVRVGSVVDLQIDPENPEFVRVTLDVDPSTPIKRDTHATLGLQGITGVAYIQLGGGSRGAPPLKAEPGQPYPVIPTIPSGLEQVLKKAPELFENAVLLSERLEQLLSPKNIDAVSGTINNLERTTAVIADRAGDIEALVTEARATLAELRRTAENANRLTTNLRPLAEDAQGTVTEMRIALKDIEGAVVGVNRFTDKLDKVVDENRTGLRDFTGSGLYELSQFIAESRELVAGLTRLVARIERDPARFFFGDTQKGFEAQ